MASTANNISQLKKRMSIAVERLIDILDQLEAEDEDLEEDNLDEEPDGEASLSWTSTINQASAAWSAGCNTYSDLEADDSDDEPINGAREGGNQTHWASGNTDDREKTWCDKELSMGWPHQIDQRGICVHALEEDAEPSLGSQSACVNQTNWCGGNDQGWACDDGEATLGWGNGANQARLHVCKSDGEREPSLGSINPHIDTYSMCFPSGLGGERVTRRQISDQRVWSAGLNDDREDEHCGREPEHEGSSHTQQ